MTSWVIVITLKVCQKSLCFHKTNLALWTGLSCYVFKLRMLVIQDPRISLKMAFWIISIEIEILPWYGAPLYSVEGVIPLWLPFDSPFDSGLIFSESSSMKIICKHDTSMKPPVKHFQLFTNLFHQCVCINMIKPKELPCVSAQVELVDKKFDWRCLNPHRFLGLFHLKSSGGTDWKKSRTPPIHLIFFADAPPYILFFVSSPPSPPEDLKRNSP